MSPPAAKRSGEKKAKIECCREWERIERPLRAKWDWQVIHQFAHSRTTFTVPTLADRARCDESRAAELVRMAELMKWIWPPAEGVWVGALSARR